MEVVYTDLHIYKAFSFMIFYKLAFRQIYL